MRPPHMGMHEPKPGSGWEEGDSPLPDVRRWRTPIAGTERYLSVSVSAGTHFAISRVRFGNRPEHTLPMLEDVGRVERDFGVYAWHVKYPLPVLPPSVGTVLALLAVETLN